MKKYLTFLLVSFSFFLVTAIYADTTIPMYLVAAKGVGKAVGTVTVTQTQYGLLFTPNLYDLPPGIHGFHIHENPSCANMGLAAGEHLDPQHTGKHLGPYGNGHEGDLPVLIVDKNGKATLPLLAPRLKLADVTGHALMIHELGDNYSDQPQKLGGGGPRLACGVIK